MIMQLSFKEPASTKVSILGETWTVLVEKPEANPDKFDLADGWCDYSTHTVHIGIFEPSADSLDRLDIYSKKVCRHEIVHAFLFESGLAESSGGTKHWALNEEMVDWIARQFPKMQKVFKELGCE